MLNPAHILEIALLLLVAFLLGAILGSVAKPALSRLIRPKATIASAAASAPVVASTPAGEQAPALVAAPVIGEVVKTPTPTAPADVTAPDFTEALLALAGDKPGSLATKIRMPSIAPLPNVAVTKAVAEMGPARVAGETTSGRAVPHPRISAEPFRAVAAAGAGAEVIPFPLEKVAVESSEVPVAVVAVEPIAEVKLADPVDPVQPVADVEFAGAANVEASIEAEVKVEASTEVDVEAEAAPVAEATAEVVGSSADGQSAEVLSEDLVVVQVESAEPAAALQAPSQQESVPVDAPERNTEDDEAAAMRAIEGNWSPRRSASGRGRKAALPEMAADDAVAASGAAVASAVQAASTAIAAELDEAPGKPVGIPAPRLGVKDDLTHVIGILPIIETALNNLGLYHFDQIAELSDDNTGWIEAHLGIAGRIGREHWREQAREFAAATASTKKVAGKQ